MSLADGSRHASTCILHFQIEGGSSDLATYILEDEDHTLGNALRYTLMRRYVGPARVPTPALCYPHHHYPPPPTCTPHHSTDTAFCGYTVPHPTENRINIRLQTKGKPAHDVLRSGLQTLAASADYMETAFDKALAKYDASK